MQTNLNIKTRSKQRQRCRLFGQVTYLKNQTEARIVNVSTAGIAVDLGGPFYGAPGSKVAVECEDIGSIEGTVRWLRNSRIGVEFSRSSNSAAKVDSYFRFFHKEIKPVIKA